MNDLGPARRSKVGLLAISALLGAPSAAAAQTQPPPQAIEPSRPQIEQSAPAAETAVPRIRVESSAAIATAPCPLDKFDLKVRIDTIRFTYPDDAALPAELATLLAPIVNAPPGGETPVAAICAIRDRATTVLRQAGYVASVQIPPQRIEDGTLALQVVAAHITEIRVNGDPGPYRETLAARIAQLQALNPLNERDAEHVLLLAGDVPGLEVQLALRPASTRPGDVIGELTVVTRRFSVLGNIQNYSSRQLGRETGYVRAALYGLTGASETYLAGSLTRQPKEQRVVQAGHLVVLDEKGTSVGGNFIYAWSRPDLDQLDLRSKSLIAGVELVRPLVRSLRRNLTVSTGLELIEQRTRVYGTDPSGGQLVSPLNRDKLRVAYVRASGGVREPNDDGSTRFALQVRAELRKGLAILDASRRRIGAIGGYQPTRAQGDPQAIVARGALDAEVGLGPVLSLYGGVRGQWANHALLNFEEYAIGNLTIGRGYDPGANSADRIIALRGEPRVRLFERPGVLRADLFGFYDSVWLYNLDNEIEDGRRLGSYGGGVRLNRPGLAQLEVAYARPTNKALLIPGAKRAADRVLGSLTFQFVPGAR